MRRLIFAALLCPAAATVASAQSIPEFDKIRTPTSPAFVVLGIATAQVERPGTPSAFAVSLLDRLGATSALLPSSFAVETAPYWWVSRPALTLTRYQQADVWTRIARSTTLSIAVTDSVPGRPAEAEADSDYRRLGLGLRTTLLSADTLSSPPCIAAMQRAVAGATEVSSAVGLAVAQAIQADPGLAADADRLEAIRGEAYEQALEALPPDRSAVLTEGAASCTETLAARRGWSIDAAAGGAIDFPGGSASGAELGSFGLWLNPAYLGHGTSAAGVLRLLWDDIHTDTTRSTVDLGVRAFRSLHRWAFSGEAVYRHLSRGEDSDDLVKLSLIFDVLLGGETWLTVTFGREFAADDARSLIALANLQWNVGGRGARPSF